MKHLWCVSLLILCAGSVFAQSTAHSIKASQIVRPLGPDNPYVAAAPDAAGPVILNVLTVIGADVAGVPCFDCVTGAATPNMGLLSPINAIHLGQTYQIDAYLYDVNYTGPCTFTIAVLDPQKHPIVSTNPTFDEVSNSGILLSTALPVPATATTGLGSVVTSAQCGTSKTSSRSPVVIAH